MNSGVMPEATDMFYVKLFVADRQCTIMSNGFIDGDYSGEFAIKGGIAMNFRIFCLLNPGDAELTSDGE